MIEKGKEKERYGVTKQAGARHPWYEEWIEVSVFFYYGKLDVMRRGKGSVGLFFFYEHHDPSYLQRQCIPRASSPVSYVSVLFYINGLPDRQRRPSFYGIRPISSLGVQHPQVFQ